MWDGWIPFAVMADSYKAGHYLQYPAATKMVAYGEFRSGFDKDTNDTRQVFYGKGGSGPRSGR